MYLYEIYSLTPRNAWLFILIPASNDLLDVNKAAQMAATAGPRYISFGRSWYAHGLILCLCCPFFPRCTIVCNQRNVKYNLHLITATIPGKLRYHQGSNPVGMNNISVCAVN